MLISTVLIAFHR